MTRTVLDNAGVAHVWAQDSQDYGRSNNGNFFFQGPALYSYGTHFLVGRIMPDGVALLNADSYSVSTSQHQADARGAVSHRTSYSLPGLTELDRALSQVARGMEGDSLLRKGVKLEIRRYCEANAGILAGRLPGWTESQYERARRVAQDEADQEGANAESWGDFHTRHMRHLQAIQEADGQADALGYLLGLVGLTRSRGAVLKTWEKAQAKAERDAARRKAERQEAEARNLAADYVRADSWSAARSWDSVIREALGRYDAESRLGDLSKALLRAQKWAKGRKGWKTRHATLQARRAHVRAVLGNLAAIQARARANEETRRAVSVLRHLAERQTRLEEAQAALEAAQERLEGQEGTPAAQACLEGLADHVERARQVSGQGCDLVKGEGRALVQSCDAQADDSDLEAAQVAALVEAAALEIIRDHAKPPRVAQAAGKALAERRDQVRAIVAERQARLEAAKDRRERERLERERATREAWLAGDPSARFYSRTAKGGAFLRAVHVERDAAGQITGGELQTSQGARVPLTHAIRVFRFLKHCRETGRPWAKNGRTLRVGYYQVDSVSPDGTFRAGCHLIEWPQVEALAARLGVLDLAPADLAEPRNLETA